jgi:cyclophilin family peptidyl-prolyl cis-trans isomerase
VATTKRQRQKDARQQRLEAQRKAQQRAEQRRRLIGVAVFAVALVGLALFLARGDDEGDEGATTTTSSTSTTTASAGAAPLTPVTEGESIAAPTPCPPADGAATRAATFAEAPPDCLTAGVDYRAEIVTSEGTVTVDLLEDEAPLTTNNFVVLSRYRFYEGVPFHRIIKGFVVQGGDPTASGNGGPGYEFADELPQAGAYVEGSLAMANSGAGTNGSQFFIVTDGGPRLQPNYSLFGTVTDGMDVVRTIESYGTEDSSGTPSKQVTIDEVRIVEA